MHERPFVNECEQETGVLSAASRSGDERIVGGRIPRERVPALVQAELQKELQERGLPKTGTKAVLAERLHGALQEERQLLLPEPEEAREELHRQYLEALARCARARRPRTLDPKP